MDTWTDRKFSKKKFQSKNVKSWHAQMMQIILPSTVLEFLWLIIDGSMEEDGLASSLRKDIKTPSIQKVPKKFEILPATNYKIQK